MLGLIHLSFFELQDKDLAKFIAVQRQACETSHRHR